MSFSHPKKNPYAPLQIPEFRSFLTGRFIFILGLRMTSTVIGWWIYLVTNSPLALGLVGLSEVVPALSLALYAGHHIDKTEKRGLMLRCLIYSLICSFLFFIISGNVVKARLDSWTIAFLIFAVVGLTGAIRAFLGPNFSAMISQVVPKEILPAAAAISSATWLIGSICGHAIGGFMIAFVGIHYTFLFVMALTATAYFFILKLKPKPVFLNAGANPWKSVKEGLKYVYSSKEIFGAITLDLFAVLFGGAAALVPVFAKDILFISAIGFGWLNAATDIGSIIMVTALTIRPLKRNQGRILFYAVAGFGACILLFALSKVFWLSFLALLLSGCLDGVSVIVRSTILQLKTPDELRGRVMSVNSMFINSSNELGQFESGVMARLMGTVPSVIFGGCMTIGVAIVTWFKAPSLRKMEY
ncbi:MAG: MFS transporter [Ferruginibacter sp.]|nr:MFS transporter [Bacteroidota bacterium]MCW5915979.1 MFS transporter [Ferruginibacter sp.]